MLSAVCVGTESVWAGTAGEVTCGVSASVTRSKSGWSVVSAVVEGGEGEDRLSRETVTAGSIALLGIVVASVWEGTEGGLGRADCDHCDWDTVDILGTSCCVVELG